jgi:hypothetical protein
MSLRRIIPLGLALAVLPLADAGAQFGGMPGMPGMGMPGAPAAASPFGAPATPPPACQQLLSLRDETQKHAADLNAAGKKKLPPEEICKLFKTFLATEARMVKGLKDNSANCGVPADVIKQVEAGHSKASQVGKQVCEQAAMGPRPAGPSLSEALGTPPTVPDTSTASRGAGTFDTLSGSPLAR